MTFFQQQAKFVVGDCYEFIRVTTDYNRHARENGESFESWAARSDQVGDILPDAPVYLGKYIKSQHSGSGDGRTRHDYFNLDGVVRANELLYDGTTRYRMVECKTKSGTLNKGGKRNTRNTRKNKKRSKTRSKRK
jgi:hypothetical protein